MTTAYIVDVVAKLEDGVTPPLLNIIRQLERANFAVTGFTDGLARLSKLNLSVARNFEKTAASALALGDTVGALGRVGGALNGIVLQSADALRNIRAMRTEMAGMKLPGGASGGASAGGREGRGGAWETTAKATGAAALWGIYENARLQDQNIKAAATLQLPVSNWTQNAAAMRDMELAYARQYAFATGGKIEPFGEAMVEGSRLLRTLPESQQKALIEATMPFAAVESKLKGIALPEAFRSFIELAHMAGKYKPSEAAPLFESMMQASLTTHMSLDQIARAASYALPSINAAGANSGDVLLLLSTMMQSGILNTKSGTWLNNMVLNALPNSLGSGLFSNAKQNGALHALGLYVGNHATFYRNGQADPMLEIAILAKARENMTSEKFNAALNLAFGKQGMRAAALFSEPQVIENLHALSGLTSKAQAPFTIGAALGSMSTIGKADQTIANATITVMNATDAASGPVNKALGVLSDVFGWLGDLGKSNPTAGAAAGAGAIAGTVLAGKKVWGAIKNPALMKPVGLGAAPLLAMSAVSDWAADTSHDQERVGTLRGISDWLGSFFDPTKASRERYEAMRSGLNSPYLPPAAGARVQVNVINKIDRNGLTTIVTDGQGRELGRPQKGTSFFDGSMSPRPVGAGATGGW